MITVDDIKAELRNAAHENESASEVGAFVSDAFLRNAGGTFNRGYHVEFRLDTYDEANQLSDILAMWEMFPKMTGHSGKFVVYLKSGECICNLLALMGATNSLLRLHDQIATRDIRNNTNRRSNCDTANITRTVNSAHAQIERLRTLDLSTLPPKLVQTAHARIENPDASLEDLAQILNISKSGLVNRLRRLMSE